MDFRLKIFCSAAEQKSFTKAAQLNFITQPAVTKNIKELEGELGVSLFERKNARVELTQAGKVYYEYAQQLLKVYEEAQYKVNELKGSFNGRLNIGQVLQSDSIYFRRSWLSSSGNILRLSSRC